MSIETIVTSAIGLIITIVVGIISAYVKSLIKEIEDLKGNEKTQDAFILLLKNNQEKGLERLDKLETTTSTDRKELSEKMQRLSDAIITLTGTIKHLEEKINDLKLVTHNNNNGTT